jgi:hypothetical protein
MADEETPQATFRYNDERTKCDVTVGDCEFPDVEIKDGGVYFLHDDVADKHFAFVVSDEDLEEDTVYELVELETEEAEDDEEEEESTGPVAVP